MRLDVRVSNPLNSMSNTHRGALARSAERKRFRKMASGQCLLQTAGESIVRWRRWREGSAITLTRIAPRPLDDDGWQAGAKPIRDGVADYLGIKDNDPRVKWQYAQQKGRPREYAVLIEIQETT